MPPEHIPVLADLDDVRYEAHTGVDIVRAGRWLPQLVEAFRVGNGPPPLPWEPEGRADPNRARFINLLGRAWLPAIADIDERAGDGYPLLFAAGKRARQRTCPVA